MFVCLCVCDRLFWRSQEKDWHSQSTPNEVSPNKVSPNDVLPKKVLPNQMFCKKKKSFVKKNVKNVKNGHEKIIWYSYLVLFLDSDSFSYISLKFGDSLWGIIASITLFFYMWKSEASVSYLTSCFLVFKYLLFIKILL